MSKAAVVVRGPYNYDSDKASLESGIDTGTDTPTIQSAKEDCDINEIMRRFGVTGQLPHSGRVPMFGDFTGITDFRGALEAVQVAQESFMELPADVRLRFENDPQRFLYWCEERDASGARVNAEDMKKYGLIPVPPPPVVPVPVRVEVVNPPPAPSKP